MSFEKFNEAVEIKDGRVTLKDKESIRILMDKLIFDAVFEEVDDVRRKKIFNNQRDCKRDGSNTSFNSGII